MPRMNIEAERARLGYTKKQMCDALGITGKTYLKYVRGDTIPSGVLIKLHELTGQSMEYLLGLSP